MVGDADSIFDSARLEVLQYRVWRADRSWVNTEKFCIPRQGCAKSRVDYRGRWVLVYVYLLCHLAPQGHSPPPHNEADISATTWLSICKWPPPPGLVSSTTFITSTWIRPCLVLRMCIYSISQYIIWARKNPLHPWRLLQLHTPLPQRTRVPYWSNCIGVIYPFAQAHRTERRLRFSLHHNHQWYWGPEATSDGLTHSRQIQNPAYVP